MSQPILVGGTTVQRIVEQQAPLFDPLEFFPKLTRATLEENRSWLEPRFIDPTTGKLILCVQSYLVRTSRHTILIDSCVGNHKPRPRRPFWDMLKGVEYERGLKAAGIGFDDVDFVMCTHLHVDHVGWNTKLQDGRWVPTFPKARYLFSDRELAYWTERQQADPDAVPWISDSVLPVVQAGRCDLVRSDHVVDDDIRFIPTPGHTIDHFSVQIGRKDQDAIITGDMIHSPLQARYPELGMMSDYDSELGARSRRGLLEQVCDTRTLLCTAHFPSPSVGRVTRGGDGFQFVED